MENSAREVEGNVLASVNYEGRVSQAYSDCAVVKIKTPRGVEELFLESTDFEGGRIPEVGQLIRYRGTLESAPDLDSKRKKRLTRTMELLTELMDI